MRVVDHVIFIVYFLLMLGVGVFFYRKNRNIEDYYVGGGFSAKHKFFTFPQLFLHFYDGRTAMIAGIISAIGYIGFTSSQLLAGAKLASATFAEIDMNTAQLIFPLFYLRQTVVLWRLPEMSRQIYWADY